MPLEIATKRMFFRNNALQKLRRGMIARFQRLKA
jgi:hypothetical protein